MSDVVIVAIVTGFFTVVNTWLSSRIKTNVEKYRKEVNGRVDELIEAKKKEAHEEGRRAGHEEVNQQQ